MCMCAWMGGLKKVSDIYHQVQAATERPVHYACSKAVVTLFAESGFRPIQIMAKYVLFCRVLIPSPTLRIPPPLMDGK